MSQTESGRDSPEVYDLPAGADIDDVEEGTPYLGRVNGVVDYGVFVDLSDSVSGLVHESTLADRSYEVGDELVVELDRIRENGDVAFEPVELAEYETVVLGDDDGDGVATVETADLPEYAADRVRLRGEVVQVKQTAGPTVFKIRDAEGVAPCAAFEAAGVRAYPEVGIDDLVEVEGTVEHRDGAVQLEVEELSALTGEAADDLAAELAAALEERTAPHDVDPLVEWEALEKLWDDLLEVARILREAVLEGRPIRVRHHADGDGMCASVPLGMALRRFVRATHADPDAPRHLFKRLPSKAPFYEMEDATRDLNFALGDRDRHGQKLPLVVMLDNGSTEEDVPAYETLREYDLPIVTIDHHHPDPEAVEGLLDAHVNPYLYGEDYRVTTGMMCVELARMVAPGVTDEVRHVPAIGGIADRSEAEAMDDYVALAREEGYDEDDLRDVSEALDYAAFWLRYDAGGDLLSDLLNVGCDDEQRHRELVAYMAEQSRADVERQLDAAMPHVESEDLDNGAHLYRVDVENHAFRFTYPAPGKTTGAIHDSKVAETGDPVITIGYGPDFAVLRSDGVRLDIPTMVEELDEGIVGGGVSGGGHLVVGSIKFVPGRREEVVDALVGKMADAEIDEDLGSTSTAPLED
jgi:RecJ-like exonuclease